MGRAIFKHYQNLKSLLRAQKRTLLNELNIDELCLYKEYIGCIAWQCHSIIYGKVLLCTQLMTKWQHFTYTMMVLVKVHLCGLWEFLHQLDTVYVHICKHVLYISRAQAHPPKVQARTSCNQRRREKKRKKKKNTKR